MPESLLCLGELEPFLGMPATVLTENLYEAMCVVCACVCVEVWVVFFLVNVVLL